MRDIFPISTATCHFFASNNVFTFDYPFFLSLLTCLNLKVLSRLLLVISCYSSFPYIRWMLNSLAFSPLNYKIVMFYHRRSDYTLPPINMNGAPLREALCLESLLGLKLTPELVHQIHC